MELELKILKEKVVDDEKKSGIGSLYDDDKTSHQHIQLLKTKYAKMKSDYDKNTELQNKKNMAVNGESFVLKAQIQTMKEQNNDLQIQFRECDLETKKKQFDLEKDVKDMHRHRLELENEIKSLASLLYKQSEEDYKNTMYLKSDNQNEEEAKRRYESS